MLLISTPTRPTLPIGSRSPSTTMATRGGSRDGLRTATSGSRSTSIRTRDVSAIELQTASRSFGDYPRELLIESTGEDGMRTALYRSPMLVPYGRALAQGQPQPSLVVNLPANRTRTLTIKQIGRTRRWFWSIHELGIFER